MRSSQSRRLSDPTRSSQGSQERAQSNAGVAQNDPLHDELGKYLASDNLGSSYHQARFNKHSPLSANVQHQSHQQCVDGKLILFLFFCINQMHIWTCFCAFS
jgi:hypothetical protein